MSKGKSIQGGTNVRPLGHDSLIRRLTDALARNRLPHALLFAGPRGVGKFLTARWLTVEGESH